MCQSAKTLGAITESDRAHTLVCLCTSRVASESVSPPREEGMWPCRSLYRLIAMRMLPFSVVNLLGPTRQVGFYKMACLPNM